MRLHSAVRVHFGHVHVVDEIDQSLGARRAVITAGLFLQRFLQHALQHFGRCVKVKRHIHHNPILRQRVELVVDKYGFTRTRTANQHYRATFLDEQVDEVANTRRFGRVYQSRLHSI